MNILLIFSGFIIAFVIALCYERKIRKLSVIHKNNVHFYVARDKDKTLWLFLGNPIRYFRCFIPNANGYIISNGHDFENLGLDIDDYKDLKWEDEPVEVFINMKD